MLWFKPTIADDYSLRSLAPISVDNYSIRFSDLDSSYLLPEDLLTDWIKV
jgi:hypothetical protein